MKIQTNHVKKIYRNGSNTCIALKDINLSIQEGEFVAICGTSGSGKTTLFNILSGIDTDYDGQCFIDHTDLSRLYDSQLCALRRDKIGVIYQFFNLLSFLTVEENILLSAQLKKEKIQKSDVQIVLNHLNLYSKRNNFIHELSGGQQQRVAIGRVLLSNPSIILADEPTGNLDSKNTKIVMELLKELQEKGKTIVLITHDQNVASYADRILYMDDGKLVSR